MQKFVKYTEEQKQAADAVRISEILDAEGEHYKKWGKQFQWQRHDSVIFVGSKWFQYSEGRGGGAIRFCETFYDMTFPEAMEYLLGNYRPYLAGEDKAKTVKRPDPVVREEKSQERKESNDEEVSLSARMPKANATMKCLYHYLIKERGIDPSVVSFFVRAGMLYETEKWHGVAFIAKDENGEVRNVHVRGTQTDHRFRMTVEGSDSRYGFGYDGEGEVLYVFEAPIDLLSFLCLYPKDWKKCSYLALNGVGGNALFHKLETAPNVKSVVLCLDNDEAGHKACARLADELRDMGFDNVRRLASQGKDWNEDLLNAGGEEEECSLSLV